MGVDLFKGDDVPPVRAYVDDLNNGGAVALLWTPHEPSEDACYLISKVAGFSWKLAKPGQLESLPFGLQAAIRVWADCITKDDAPALIEASFLLAVQAALYLEKVRS